VLSGKDTLGCAETGSGKTAAFALPILHKLSQDPYGVFAVVLTPTRELAVQIAEQFEVFGAPLALRCELVIGGLNMAKQALALQRRPHVIVATPGRLRHHLSAASPPDLSTCRSLVLDEADRLLTVEFER
jgi:superfamily II DNA/RNA helicase